MLRHGCGVWCVHSKVRTARARQRNKKHETRQKRRRRRFASRLRLFTRTPPCARSLSQSKEKSSGLRELRTAHSNVFKAHAPSPNAVVWDTFALPDTPAYVVCAQDATCADGKPGENDALETRLWGATAARIVWVQYGAGYPPVRNNAPWRPFHDRGRATSSGAFAASREGE